MSSQDKFTRRPDTTCRALKLTLNILIILSGRTGAWRINCIGHWISLLRDDASRKQKDNAAQNFFLLNRIGLNIIKNAKVSSMGVKGHRKKAGWDNDYLLYALKSFDVVKKLRCVSPTIIVSLYCANGSVSTEQCLLPYPKAQRNMGLISNNGRRFIYQT